MLVVAITRVWVPNDCMLARNGGSYEPALECDCGRVVRTSEDVYVAAQALLRRDGWPLLYVRATAALPVRISLFGLLIHRIVHFFVGRFACGC